MAEAATVFTIGHSNLTMAELLRRLQANGVNLVVDVRSWPRSRHVPHFNQERLGPALSEHNIAYRHSGEHLGGRPQENGLYTSAGQADYRKMAQTPGFQAELSRVIQEAGNRAVALLCTEHDPDKCHRALLVGHQLHLAGCQVEHIVTAGKIRTHEELLEQLSLWHGKGGKQVPQDMAVDAQARIAAYRKKSG